MYGFIKRLLGKIAGNQVQIEETGNIQMNSSDDENIEQIQIGGQDNIQIISANVKNASQVQIGGSNNKQIIT